MPPFLIYGANGYTGSLIARQAKARGLTPILAGRNRAEIEALGRELTLETRVFSLDDPQATRAGLEGATAVLHCAGPFSRTSAPMASACIATKAHYMDVTGEVGVFEALAARDAEAKAAGVMLLPGVGFDVVPSDCLAAHLKRRLPSATHLALGMWALGQVSRGTATTIVENLNNAGWIRRNGALVPVPAAYRTRTIDFGEAQLKSFTISWGDISTAYRSTGIPNIEVYLASSLGRRIGARLSRYLGWLLGSATVQQFLIKRIRSGPSGPTDAQRASGGTVLWGEATDEKGNRVIARLHGPEGYALTMLAALACTKRVLNGEAKPGFQTPSLLFGPDFVLEIEGVRREDVV